MGPYRVLRPLAVALVWLLPQAAWADESQEKLDTCLAQTTDAERRIAACDWLLRKKSVPPSNLPNIYFNLARGFDEKGLYDRAIKIYGFLLERLPQEARGYAVVRMRRGESYRRQGNYDGAIADYDWLLARNPKDEWARNGRATAYANNGQPDRAIADYKVMMQQMRDAGQQVDDALYINRAHAYRRKGDMAKAKADFDQAIALKPISRNYAQRAWFFYRTGENAKAMTDAERAIALEPMNAQGVDVLAHLLALQGRPERALLTFEWAMLIGGDAMIRHYQKALSGHGYRVRDSGKYDKKTNAAFVACLKAGCRLTE